MKYAVGDKWKYAYDDGCKIAFNRLLETFCGSPSKINEQNQCDIIIQASQSCENFYK